MLAEQDRQHRDRDRQAFGSWWAGDRRRPFILDRRKAYSAFGVLFPNWRATLCFHLRYGAMWLVGKVPYSSIKVCLYRLMGVKIGGNVYIAPGVFLDAFYPQLIELADDCFLGTGCRILVHECAASYFRVGGVRIGRGTVVGGWSIVRSGVTLGEAVTTGLGSVVVSDVADGLTVGGVPARPLTSHKDES